ncbi:MAG: hypothetical protein ACRYG8_08285 [Janthinobacterium lividum]
MRSIVGMLSPISVCILPEVLAVAVADYHPGYTAACGAENAVMHEMAAYRAGRAVFETATRFS